MTPEQFMDAVKRVVHDAAVRDMCDALASGPAGAQPPRRSVELAAWYARLDAAERAHVTQIVREAVHAGLFGLFAVIDGARRFDRAGGRLELWYVAPDGARTLLVDPPRAELHGLYQDAVHENVFGAPD